MNRTTRYPLCLYMFGALFLSQYAAANALDIRISESSMNNETYVKGGSQETLNPNSSADAKKLGESVKFEIYKINENSSSHTVFESPAGVCYGYTKSNNGVSYTNSTNHYIKPNDKSEYYGSVTGATIYQKDSAKDLRYAPVYYINNQMLSHEIRLKEDKALHQRAIGQIQDGNDVLNEVVCK